MNEVMQGHNIGVFQVLQQRHWGDRPTWVPRPTNTSQSPFLGPAMAPHPGSHQVWVVEALVPEARGADPDIVPSRMAVQGAPSSCSSRISFRATRFSVSLLRPLKTVA